MEKSHKTPTKKKVITVKSVRDYCFSKKLNCVSTGESLGVTANLTQYLFALGSPPPPKNSRACSPVENLLERTSSEESSSSGRSLFSTSCSDDYAELNARRLF
ncbi:Oidioi.mRNA.OKI2018_I69.PAR.g12513.t1.cds [Oikopleura dioica]|uniref:Oidioi.mRNA.OKI2018_I69.PAR.g12513.t1.cds n=1 Tax=Oikopleura dioica TaxID=34765 RepID=A0ABN7S3U6_OIKDI|nr:Oidioi.mRNA.OKI2018_I69.PAR.g12513.t1.cds [Oikopleura dioica]